MVQAPRNEGALQVTDGLALHTHLRRQYVVAYLHNRHIRTAGPSTLSEAKHIDVFKLQRRSGPSGAAHMHDASDELCDHHSASQYQN